MRVVGLDIHSVFAEAVLLDEGSDRNQFHHVDFADHNGLDGALGGTFFDRIAHLGAQPGVRYSIENPRAYIQANLVGHANMLELARNRGV